MSTNIRVVLVDDQQLIRVGFRRILETEPDIEVVGEATVKTHVSSILAKLEVRDRVGAVIVAYESGPVETGKASE